MDDLIRRQAVKDILFNKRGVRIYTHKGEKLKRYAEIDLDDFDAIPSVQPEQRWIPVTETPPRGRDLMLKIHDACNSFFYYHMGFYDGEKYFTYNFFWQRDKDLEIVGWQLCTWEEGEQ